MLSAKVWITTPTVSVMNVNSLSFPSLEPSIFVKIRYTKGITGQNVLILKQDDVQLILNQLMGLPLEVSEDFKFDEMNISAVCEVMNQMMGASATALSEIIETMVDISTPEAVTQDDDSVKDRLKLYEVHEDEEVVTVKFSLTVDNVINSEFISVLTLGLAMDMADKMLKSYAAEEEPAPAPPAPAIPAAPAPDMMTAGISQAMAPPQGMAAPQQPAAEAGQAYPSYGTAPQYQVPPPMSAAMPAYPGQPYGGYLQPQMNIQPAQFQNFAAYQNPSLTKDQNDNLRLLMDVPLSVTVEIGSTSKKVKEILEFTQGTIIELERQAGAPVDIIVNGNLVAKGDVVVIDDNFAVRITEIIKSKFLDILSKE
jgi:flagellar motor switch protein FliN/FliY